MALAKLPYTAKLTAKATDANGAWLLTTQILDGNSVVRGTVTVTLTPTQTLADLRSRVYEAIDAQLVADAGSRDAWLAGVIAGGGALPG